MQIFGIGVALRILMRESDDISRNEFSALINTMAKWIESVSTLKQMEDILYDRSQGGIVYLSVLFLFIILVTNYFQYFIEIIDKYLKKKTHK